MKNFLNKLFRKRTITEEHTFSPPPMPLVCDAIQQCIKNSIKEVERSIDYSIKDGLNTAQVQIYLEEAKEIITKMLGDKGYTYKCGYDDTFTISWGKPKSELSDSPEAITNSFNKIKKYV